MKSKKTFAVYTLTGSNWNYSHRDHLSLPICDFTDSILHWITDSIFTLNPSISTVSFVIYGLDNAKQMCFESSLDLIKRHHMLHTHLSLEPFQFNPYHVISTNSLSYLTYTIFSPTSNNPSHAVPIYESYALLHAITALATSTKIIDLHERKYWYETEAPL